MPYPEKLAARFPDLDRALDPERDADDPAWAVVEGDIPAGHVEGLGTVGRGNHFVELARIGTVFEPDHASRLGLAAGDLVLIVHSGSRGLGERILRAHTEVHGAGPAPDPAAYLAMHDDAVRWGSLNRRLMAARVAHALGAEPTEPIVDQCHNLVEVRDGVYLHRKGAAPGDGRDVLIAGTRGTPSYLVAAHAGPDANHSVAHGAGRKMSRADALRRGRAKHTVEELRRTPVGSLVVCGDRQLLFEEAPTAYKRIEQVIADLVDHGLATPVATTVPLVTYKTPDLGSDAAGPPGPPPQAGPAVSVHLLLSAGRGPQECAWALAQLLHRLEADAARRSLGDPAGRDRPGDRPGTYRSVLIRIAGAGAEAFAASWTGTLCWQAPSPYRASTGRKNWYVTAQPCQVDAPRTTFAEADVDVVACRTGGPGGQHRNKASTAVRATHRPTGTRRRGRHRAAVQPQPPHRPAAAAAAHRARRRGGRTRRHHRPLAHPRRARPRQPHPYRTPGPVPALTRASAANAGVQQRGPLRQRP